MKKAIIYAARNAFPYPFAAYGSRRNLLYCNTGQICNVNTMAVCDAAEAGDFECSYGSDVLDHLAADGAGLTGGQVAVVAVLEIHADLGSGLLLELVHGLTGLGDVDAVVALLHFLTSPSL